VQKKKGGFLLRALCAPATFLYTGTHSLMLRFVSGNQIESPVTAPDYVAPGAGAIVSNPDWGMERNGKLASVRFDGATGWSYRGFCLTLDP
jgi:hypothetical protein